MTTSFSLLLGILATLSFAAIQTASAAPQDCEAVFKAQFSLDIDLAALPYKVRTIERIEKRIDGQVLVAPWIPFYKPNYIAAYPKVASQVGIDEAYRVAFELMERSLENLSRVSQSAAIVTVKQLRRQVLVAQEQFEARIQYYPWGAIMESDDVAHLAFVPNSPIDLYLEFRKQQLQDRLQRLLEIKSKISQFKQSLPQTKNINRPDFEP